MKTLVSRIKLSHRKFIATTMAAGVAASGTLVWTASNAAFTAQTTNGTNSWTTGTMSLTDDDTAAMFAGITGILPGGTGSRCIRVTYTGTTPAAPVKLYATFNANQVQTGGGSITLGEKLKLKVEIGDGATNTAEFDDNPTCAGHFATAITQLYPTGGAPLTDTAFGFIDSSAGNYSSYANGLSTGWTPATGEVRVFKVTWTLDAGTDDTFQNLNCGITFKWEAQQGT